MPINSNRGVGQRVSGFLTTTVGSALSHVGYSNLLIAGRTNQSQCLFFNMLPPEIRLRIYRYVLVSIYYINQPSERIGMARLHQRSLGTYCPIPDISATILRTCRAIYDEALPVLYGGNQFNFSTVKDIVDFKSVGLDEQFSRTFR